MAETLGQRPVAKINEAGIELVGLNVVKFNR